ncbi:branched-chain amino acid transport system substrate-binding protein [Angulomicrobium tetraedrale]|uniref:Branched-chain amino acid transport system substrate-binding protein n=1 Tax=Ancylobacter tetraedralis TaxID=217068 RepID=A0A839Z9B5_9HYPH|nr:ABC transporter substrate-binding protein [Ancylobacter tetraedralis]MBB3771408.1 branched-chain amino acid transport system substrate-binding protein [Ancylobacter tetraedralis]
MLLSHPTIGRLVLSAAVTCGLAVPSYAEDILIGVATAQTGGLAPYDQPSLAGFRMAIDELNAKGGLGGKYTAKLAIKDTRTDTAATITAVQELVDAGASIILTPCDADATIAAGQITVAKRIPTLTFCGTAPVLATAVGDNLFGTYPGDNLQATVIADHAYAKGFRKAYLLVSPDSSYTAQLPEYFAEVFKKKGGTILGTGSFTMGQPDFSAIVTAIKALPEQPDLIMTAAYEPDFPAFIQQLRAAGVTTTVYGADAIGTGTVQGLGKLVDGTVYSAAGYPTPGGALEAFNKRFETTTGHAAESAYEANGYEIGLILDAAVKAAGSTDPVKLRDAIAGLDKLPIVTGTITYAGTNGMPVRAVSLIEYKDGKPVFIATQTPAAADVPAPAH